MRVFDQGNWSGDECCPLCDTQDAGAVILLEFPDTLSDGVCEAVQVHGACAAQFEGSMQAMREHIIRLDLQKKGIDWLA